MGLSGEKEGQKKEREEEEEEEGEVEMSCSLINENILNYGSSESSQFDSLLLSVNQRNRSELSPTSEIESICNFNGKYFQISADSFDAAAFI